MNPPTTITYLHTFNDKNEITARQPNGLWYLPEGCASYVDVPIGGQFTLVSPVSWQLSTFEVVWLQVPKVDKAPCRYYEPRELRPLTEYEIEYLKGVVGGYWK